MNGRPLGDFKVLHADGLRRSFDDYARTDDGRLLKRDAHGAYTEVPKRGEYLIQQDDMDFMEVW